MRRTTLVVLVLVVSTGRGSAADPPLKYPERWREPDVPDRENFWAKEMRLSADGRRLVVVTARGRESVVRAWNLTDGTSRTLLSDDKQEVWAVLSPDGKWVATTHGSDLAVWNPAAGRKVWSDRLAGHEDSPWGGGVNGFDPDGGVWVIRPTGMMNRIEISSGKVTQSLELPAKPSFWGKVRLSPDGKWVAIGGGTVFALRRTDPVAGWVVIERHREAVDPWDDFPNPTACPIPLAFSPDGRRLLTQNRDGEVMDLWSVGDKPTKLASQKAGMDRMIHVEVPTFTPDGKRVAAVLTSRSLDGRVYGVRVWDAASLKEVARADAPAEAVRPVITPDGTKVVYALQNGTLTVRDVPTK